MPGTLHVIGGGMAGLAAALAASAENRRVELWERAARFGGRCRSFEDARLERRIDNGNHLLLAGNGAARRFLQETGGERATRLTDPRFAFFDLGSGRRWTVGPRPGRLPRFALPPETSGWRLLRDLWRVARLRPDAVLALALPAGIERDRVWEPLVVAVVNQPIDEAVAAGFRRVLREVLPAGAKALRPVLFPEGLSAALVDPVLATLRARGVVLRSGERITALEIEDNRVQGLHTRKDTMPLGPKDAVVLALPPAEAAALLPGLEAPAGSSGILNGHFRVAQHGMHEPFLGLLGGTAEWLFHRDDVLSVTVSAADRLFDLPEEALAGRLWQDVARALGRAAEPLPPYRLIREKRATFAQTPLNERCRPVSRTDLANLTLAGDWTRTSLPATIEGAIRSGFAAINALEGSR